MVWQTWQGYGRYYDVSVALVAANGTVGPELTVNARTAGYQVNPSVGSWSSGGFVVAWASFDDLVRVHVGRATRGAHSDAVVSR